MAGKKLELGPTGETVAANVKRLRQKLRMNYTELSSKLAEHGRQIPPLAVRRIEEGDRRVDADDLLALAVSLKTNPNALLFPPSTQHVLTITGGMHPAWEVWKWARGESPLTHDAPDDVPPENRSKYAQALFESQSDPDQQEWTQPNIHPVEVPADGDD